MKDSRFLTGCPSIEKYNFHSWSAGGRLITSHSLLQERVDIDDAFLDVVYQCQMCGSCDVSCKTERDLEPNEVLQDLRTRCVEEGGIIDEHMEVIESLKQEDNSMMESKEDRANWCEGLTIKDLSTEKADVLFHVGCRYSFDESLWSVVRTAVTLLQDAGVDLGIMGKAESCCGGRAYEMGFQGEFTKFAQHQNDTWRSLGVKTVVTPCSDCYQAFTVLYDKAKMKPEVEIVHITQYIDRLIKDGTIQFTKEIPMTVTYHDPCHLGRLSEPWVHWEGEIKKVQGQLLIHDPPKKKRLGANGVYDIPRNILKAIPGLNLVEMYRIREYSWCCGAGGGVLEAYPDFAEFTAGKRLEEAEAVGAEAIVSACGWCKRSFTDASAQSSRHVKVYDIVELVQQAM
jgi:Fe-S oxidoreductase